MIRCASLGKDHTANLLNQQCTEVQVAPTAAIDASIAGQFVGLRSPDLDLMGERVLTAKMLDDVTGQHK